MVTSMAVTKVGDYGFEDRSWLVGEHGADAPINVVLNLAAFTGTNFTADNTVKSGCILAKEATGTKYGPYDPSNTTTAPGVAIAVLFDSFTIPSPNTLVVTAAALVHFHGKTARLPYSSGLGSLDASGITDLKLAFFD